MEELLEDMVAAYGAGGEHGAGYGSWGGKGGGAGYGAGGYAGGGGGGSGTGCWLWRWHWRRRSQRWWIWRWWREWRTRGSRLCWGSIWQWTWQWRGSWKGVQLVAEAEEVALGEAVEVPTVAVEQLMAAAVVEKVAAMAVVTLLKDAFDSLSRATRETFSCHIK